MYHTKKELHQMAKNANLKYSSIKTTEGLCKLLGIPHVKNEKFEKYHRHTLHNPVRITFRNINSDKTIVFKSITSAAKTIGKNPSCIPFYIRRNSTIVYNGEKWKVERM